MEVPFTPGRMDASQEQTDVEIAAPCSNQPLTASATISSGKQLMMPEEALVDKAQFANPDGA